MMTIIKSPDIALPRINVIALCRDCRHQHNINVAPDLFGRAAFDWEFKHRGHDIEFVSAKRVLPKYFDDRIYEHEGDAPWWLNYKHNADVKISYVADGAITMDLSALAASSTFVAGREATAIANSSNYLDYEITGTFISGTTPTAPAEHRLYYIKATEDTPTWPDSFTASDAAKTVTNTNILSSFVLGWSGTASTVSNITYPVVSALTLAQAFGICPKNFTLFFTHAHTAALKTDANNTNKFYSRGIYATVV